MDAAAVALPPGFQLDGPPSPPPQGQGAPGPGAPSLPPGFELDAPQNGGRAVAGNPDIPSDFGGLVVRMSPPTPNAAGGAGAQARSAPSVGESLGRGAVQGATMNWDADLAGVNAASGLPGSDTTMGLVPLVVGGAKLAGEKLFGSPTTVSDLVAPGSGSSASDLYERGKAKELEANAAAKDANPVSYLAGNLAGGIAGAVGLPAVAPFKAAAAGAPIVERAIPAVGNLVAGGATYGGISGAGGAEGGLEQKLEGALEGAKTGALMAPAIGAGLRGAGKALAPVVSHVKATFSPASVADNVVAHATGADAADLSAIADRMEAAQAEGQPLTLADSAGHNTQSVAGTVARFPGPARNDARQFLDTRQVGSETSPGQGDRISDALGHLVGSDAGSLATAEQIIAKRSAQATPLYNAARSATIPDAAMPIDLLRRLKAAGALPEAIKKARIEGTPFDISKVESWDRMKRALDDRIGPARKAGRGDDVRILTGLKHELTDAIDKAVPAYRAARQVFAGHSEMVDALAAGKDAFNPTSTVESIKAQVAGMSPGEAEMFRLGAANALREKLGNATDGVDKSRLAFGSPANRAKIRALAPDAPSMERFGQFLKNEQDMFATRSKATGNSATAERLNEDAEAAAKIADNLHIGSNIMAGNWKGVIIAVARHTAKLDPAKRAAVLSAVRDIALDPNPDTVRAFAARIQATEMARGIRRSVIGAVMRGLPRAITTVSTERHHEATAQP